MQHPILIDDGIKIIEIYIVIGHLIILKNVLSTIPSCHSKFHHIQAQQYQ
jgi:hypothetical protein